LARRRRWSFFMSPLEHRFIRVLDDWYRTLLTPMGRALLWGTLASAMLLVGGLHRPLLLCFGFCSGALGCGVVVGFFFRPRVRLTRVLPPPPSAGDTLRYTVVVENVGRRTLRNLVVEERGLPPELRPAGPPPVIDILRPGESVRVSLQLVCHERGVYVLKALQAASMFPSGLVKPGRKHRREDRLLVYPRFTPMESFEVPVGRNYQPGGIPVASQVGESCEFFGTREWREGDRLRDIHWPSLARTGQLIVKEYQEEYCVRLAMGLDVEVRNRRDEARFEHSLSMAAAIADALARREHIVDIFAAGPQIFHFQAGRALAHFENILEILACLEPGDRLNMEALEATLLPEAPRLSAVILVVMDWDEPRAALVQKLKEHGVAIRVLSLRPDRRPTGLAPDEIVEAA